LDEAALLVGRALHTEGDMEGAATALLAMGAQAVLVKGGHLTGEVVSDLLALSNGERIWMRDARIHTSNTHGTGCTLSSAIAAHLALGQELVQAVQSARSYIRGALLHGAQVRTGQGSGPLNHGYAPQAMVLRPRH
jgi:hydroxymethylpyrimidine/phosphomethylpyrimidine kinase